MSFKQIVFENFDHSISLWVNLAKNPDILQMSEKSTIYQTVPT